MKRFEMKLLHWSLLLVASPSVWADELLVPLPSYSQLNHGGVGLIQMPTARMNPDGDFSVNYRDSQEYRLWSASLQLMPWLETTIRYSDVRTRFYSDDPDFSGDQSYKDKGIDAKLRLWQESRYLPALAMGFRDLGGTGLFASEYLALAKRWRDVDIHLGIGWGYLGQQANITNPLCEIKDSFCERPTGFSGAGGSIDYQRFFKGPASLYGGIEYRTPWKPLLLKIEYDGNNYQQDFAGVLPQDRNWNIAAVYSYNNNFDLMINHQRGNTFGFGVSYRFNFHTVDQIKIVPAPRIVPDRLPAATTKVERFDLSFRLYTEAGLLVDKYQLTEDSVVLQGYSVGFRDQDEFINRLGRVLATEVPETVKSYRVTEMSGQLPMVETVIDADKFIDFARKERLDSQLADSVVRQEPDLAERDWAMIVDHSGFYTGFDAFWIQTFGSPERFYMYQGGLLLSSGYNLNQNWSLNSTAKINVLTNFDEFKFSKDAFDTGVPRVRTLIREYVQGNDIGLENLYGLWKTNLQKDWYAQVYAGYLETMYAGAGAEVLYRPIDSRLAIGVDVNYVGQRDFDRTFGLFDYRVVTGQVTAYWQPEFIDDVMLKVGVGRYLAKDHGVTVDFSRRFDSGVVVGAYATKTNLSAEEYGEGSFTKGFYLSFPFDLFSITPSTGRGNLPWVPISRDGGQPLNRPSQLFSLTDVRSPFSK
jgi:hypothetical protein